MFSTEITETEKRLGFKIGKIPNPLGSYVFQKKYIDAVLYELDERNVVVKFDQPLPLSGVGYVHQCKEGDIWDVIGKIEYEPDPAIKKAKARVLLSPSLRVFLKQAASS